MLIIFFGLTGEVSAQNFHLVKDINQSTDANPSNFNPAIPTLKNNIFANWRGVSYFAADDGAHGIGLWRSDGTQAGTYQVKAGVTPENIVVSNDRLFFAGSGTTGLWKSDGTEAGTIPVLSALPAGVTRFVPFGITDLNGTAFFSLEDTRNQLWKTDGTASGTVMVTDLISQNFSNLNSFKAIKNKLYFTAISSTDFFTSRLWVTSGSAEGTYMISNTIAAPQQMMARSSDLLDSLVYFTGAVSQYGNRYLYTTTGAPGNANMAAGYTPMITFNPYPMELPNINGTIYFLGGNFNAQGFGSLYKYDINNPSVQLVKDAGSTPIQYVTAQNGNLFFTISNLSSNVNQLWKSDGTIAGNLLLKDSLLCGDFTNAGGQIYASASDNNHGYELWRSDGTLNGTMMVKDINPGKNSSGPAGLTYINGKLLFSAQDDSHGKELWLSAGTSAGTFMLKDINQTVTASSSISGMASSGNTVFFASSDTNGNFPVTVWKSDGSSAGTFATSDTIYIRDQRTLTPFNNQLFFFGITVSGASGLFKADGASGATTVLKDFGTGGESVLSIVPANTLVYFYVYDYAISLAQLWRTDGTLSNTYVIKDSMTSLDASKFLAVDNELYFFPNNTDLWKTNGTTSGTTFVKSFTYNPVAVSGANGKFFISVYDGSNTSLWKSDGSTFGTVKVTDKVTSVNNFFPSNGSMYFIANGNPGTFGDIGQELYKTDGTESGTVLVKDIHPGASGTTIFSPVTLDSTFYFFTAGTVSGTTEFWKTDGTGAGTELITAIPNSDQQPQKAVTSNGKIFFVINNSLWESSGSKESTSKVNDDIFSDITIDGNLPNIAAVGNQLFFTASSYRFGKELYAGNISPAIITYTTNADGNWNDPNTWTGKVVPPAGFNIIIKNKVIGNINATCNSLKVQMPGSLTINTGVKINISH